ncbi:hypothetical protein UA18_03481 [Burkholderia multivorans]|uniref:Bacteriophage protein n=1 Tax=Burkholderia multivorans TaxID=87883 RepID=A0ABD7L6Q6_9BURK|nr:hypothetical protein [Burkholderia multivorans]SAJ96707.1 hypothetical protein UA18_03481 [Burkholderia multivorans]
MYLIKNLGLDNKGKRWAVARVELSEPRPSANGVNMEVSRRCRAMVDAARAKEANREQASRWRSIVEARGRRDQLSAPRAAARWRPH